MQYTEEHKMNLFNCVLSAKVQTSLTGVFSEHPEMRELLIRMLCEAILQYSGLDFYRMTTKTYEKHKRRIHRAVVRFVDNIK